MEFEIKEEVKIEDGAHTGAIVAVEYRTEPYKYTDVIIEFEEGKRIKYGCATPFAVTKGHKLGRLLEAFGAKLEPGQKVDPEKVLVGKKCIFSTFTEEKGGSSYANIVPNTLKPLSD